LNKKKVFSKVSDYPECNDCPVRATDDCPAFYRMTENCPYYKNIIQKFKKEGKN